VAAAGAKVALGFGSGSVDGRAAALRGARLTGAAFFAGAVSFFALAAAVAPAGLSCAAAVASAGLSCAAAVAPAGVSCAATPSVAGASLTAALAGRLVAAAAFFAGVARTG